MKELTHSDTWLIRDKRLNKLSYEEYLKSYKWIKTKNPMRGLIPLCEKHHKKVHNIAKHSNISVLIATKLFLSGVNPAQKKKQKAKHYFDRLKLNSYAYNQSKRPKRFMRRSDLIALRKA